MTTSIQESGNVQEPEGMMKKRQEINEMQNEIKVLRTASKNQTIKAVGYLASDIMFVVLFTMYPPEWYYWIMVVVGIVFTIRAFLKRNEWIGEANAKEEMIIRLEKEIRSLESEGR